MALKKDKEILIKAINEMGRRVSAADISAKTGLPVNLSVQVLNQIAEEASGHLQVSKTGDIAYEFPRGFQNAYISRGIKRTMELFFSKTANAGFFLLRISFGIMLVLSLVIIVLLFFAIMMGLSRGREDNEELNFDFSFFDWMILRDLLYWQISYDGANDKKKSTASNFLYDCFSFLFGDGNPNVNIENRKWHDIAQLIRQNKGVVTVEQLSPFTGEDPHNEDSVLPVLVRFDGRPTVTDSGHIIYLFPSLQTTALSSGSPMEMPRYLQAFPWQFSKASSESLVWVTILAAVNFVGSWCLFIEAAKFIPSLVSLLLILVIYGTLFVLIPLGRYIFIQFLNNKIEEKNKKREIYANSVAKPDALLLKKMAEAGEMAINSRQIKAEDVVYDTQKDVLEQEFKSISNA